MELTILRHGIAVKRGPGVQEPKRALTAKGAAKMHAIARAMNALSLEFDVILSSPWLRARQTAAIVAEELDAAKRLELSPLLLPAAELSDLVEQVRAYNRDRVLLVGHEPALSTLISILTTGSEDAPILLKKGGLCRLDAGDLRYGQCATLAWLLTPAHMLLMA
jgi:phosphohistidine phosphatase